MEIVRELSNVEVICHTLKFNKGASSLHWHDKYELCRVESEKCSFIVDGETINAYKGDIVAINESTLHQFIIEKNDTCVAICQFPVKILFSLSNSVNSLKKHITAEEINSIPELEKNVSELFEMMKSEKTNGTGKANNFLKSLAIGTYFLLETYFPESDETGFADRDRREFYTVTEYINEHFKESITVDSISKNLYISRGRLSTLFSKYACEGINFYINNLRVKHANFLLSRGMNVADAAFESGFQSIRTFNNVYKNIMKITPSEYLNKKK